MVRYIAVIGIFLFMGALAGVYLLSKTKPAGRIQHDQSDIGVPKTPSSDGGSMNYWLGQWDVEVKPTKTPTELKDEEREPYQWSKTVLAELIGDWAIVPGTKKNSADSPLKRWVPKIDAESIHNAAGSWIDLQNREWEPSGAQSRKSLWIQTRVKHQGREVLLGLSFKEVPKKTAGSEAFDLVFMLSCDNAESWRPVATLAYRRTSDQSH